MSKVYFAQPKTPYDEEQAFQRHLAYLKTQSAISQQYQDAQRNIQMGTEPPPPRPMTASEVLENEMELNKLVQKYLRLLVADTMERETEGWTEEERLQFVKRARPSKYIFERMTPQQKRILVQNFPAINAELKNYQFIDADFLLEYLRKYQEAFDNTGGVSRLSRNNIAVGEIKALIDTMPKIETINRLKQSIKDVIKNEPRNRQLEVLLPRLASSLQELTDKLPLPEDLFELIESAVIAGNEQVGSQKSGMTNEGLIQEVMNKVETLPTDETFKTFLNDFLGFIKGSTSVAQVVEASKGLEGTIYAINPQVVDDLDKMVKRRKSRGKKEKEPPSGQPTISSFMKTTAPRGELVKQRVSQYEPEIIQPSPLPSESEQPFMEGVGLRSIALNAKRKVQPKFSVMVGKGLSLDKVEEAEPKYIEFGKFALSQNHLKDNKICVRNLKTGHNISDFPITPISDDLMDILETFIQTEKLNERQLKKLSQTEKKLFSKLLNRSGLYGKYKIRVSKTEEEKEEEERFNLVKGQIIAGNDNAELVKELKRFLMKFVLEGKIPKKEAYELLFQLTYI